MIGRVRVLFVSVWIVLSPTNVFVADAGGKFISNEVENVMSPVL
jgi:hypothetical protein